MSSPSPPNDEGEAAAANDDKEDINALLEWLWTFPQLSGTGIVRDGESGRCRFDDPAVAIAFLHAAQEIYGTPPTDPSPVGASDAWEETVKVAGSDVGVDSIMNGDDTAVESILSALLCQAVSGDCEGRETYISRIMGLQSDVQRVLMTIIERGVQVDDKENEGPDEESVDAASAAAGSPESAALRRSRDEDSHLSRSGYTPQRKKRVDSSSRPLSAVSMRSIGGRDGIFSPDGSIFSPTESSEVYNHTDGEIKELKEKLEFVSSELEVARQRESEQGSKLEEIESKHRAEKMKIESEAISREKDMSDKYAGDVAALQKELEELRNCRQEAQEAKEELAALRDEVDVLHHNKGKLASTEEQLRKCKEKLEQMGDAKNALERAEEAHSTAVAKSLEMENELKALQPLRRQLEDYKTRAVDAEVQLAECQEELQKLQKLSEELSGINKDLKQGVMIQQSESEEMKKRLLEDGEAGAGASVQAVGEGMSELNPALMAEMKHLRNENARLTAFAAQREDDSVQKLEESLDDNQRLAKKFKEQFLATKNELQEAQLALRESMAREKQLKLEITTLKDEIISLENKVKDERLASQKAQLDAERTLQSTKRGLIDKARTDLESLETKMNCMLDAERAASKEKLAKADEEMRAFEQKSAEMLSDVQEKSSAALQASREQAHARFEDMEKEHRAKMEQATKEAAEEREKLVSKGKNMIKDIKADAKERLREKDEAHEAEKEEVKQMMSKFTEEQKEYEEKARAKIAQYKHKLHVALGRQNQLTDENEGLQEKQKKLEREKVTLQGENDRFRRQLGCRFGADSDTQKQFEMLQREFNLMLEENRALQQKLSAGGSSSSFDSGMNLQSVSSASQYIGSGSQKGTSTIAQLRAEYEETIQTLQDEKRELVMKNSAAISDVQKADQRSWELEEELTKTKNQVTSLSLSLQRIERQNMTSDVSFAKGLASPDPQNNSFQTYHSTLASPDVQGKENIPTKSQVQVETPGGMSLGGVSSNTPMEGLSIKVKKSPASMKQAPSLMDYTKVRADGAEEGKQECQQS